MTAQAALEGPGVQACPPHWLRPNENTRTPHRVLVLDTETRPQLAGNDELHTLRWWHARLTRRHVERPRGPVQTDYAGETIGQLAEIIDQAAITKATLWLYTHNLGFDLAVTRLPEMLNGRGWEISDLGITGRSPWIRMINGRRRLVMCDSASWLPVALAAVAESIGMVKPVIEDWSAASNEDIAIRCLADVAILSTALLDLMDWWDREDMGKWQWTGPGCGWAAFRHKHLHHKVLMDPEPGRVTLERQAIYGGRREAYAVGTLQRGRYADLDFENAYPVIAATTDLPRRAIARVPSMTPESYGDLPADWGILSDCTVTTWDPVVPCRIDGHVFYPVGTFRTTLAGPDIAAAIDAGAHLELGDTIVYQLAPWLASWGKWVTSVIDGSAEGVPAVARTWAKHVSRTVIGRLAMRRQRVEDWGDAAWPFWHAEPGTDLETGCEVIDLHACGRHLRIIRDDEPDNVFPAVTAWVEATCRQLLRDAMLACPPGMVLQCDTDGFMIVLPEEAAAGAGGPAPEVADRGVAAGQPAPAWDIPQASGPARIRVKGFYSQVTVLGPQQLIADGSRRIAGIPKAFTLAGAATWQGHAWPGYTWQLAHSQPGVYTRPHVRIPLRGPYGSRWVLKDGSTLPPACDVVDGRTVLLRPLAGHLAETQPSILTRYVA